MVACLNENALAPVLRFTAQVILIHHPNEIRPGYTPIFYCHTSTFPGFVHFFNSKINIFFIGRFIELVSKIDKRTGAVIEEKPKTLKQGDAAIVIIEANKPQCLEAFKDCPPLGRFAMRDIGLTIGVGVIKSVEKMLPSKVPAKSAQKAKSKYFR
jgi:elongation factor 1-alpha